MIMQIRISGNRGNKIIKYKNNTDNKRVSHKYMSYSNCSKLLMKSEEPIRNQWHKKTTKCDSK